MSFSPSIAGLSGPLAALSEALSTSNENAFAQLGSTFVTRLPATPLNAPYVVGFSSETAAMLGLEPGLEKDPGFAELFSGNATREWPADALPYASVYSGHQFGVWAGQLGDGRALGLGEVEHDGQRFELQLKGAGRTPYSRMGDGRAVLRSSIREYLGSEAMQGLGIPTTRALAVTGSPAPVRREEVETAAVVTRVAPSFIRFGHFEHFAARNQLDQLKALADFVIDRFYPQCRSTDPSTGSGRTGGNAYAAFLEQVSERTAAMVARWQAVGFCHGVMNTDNMSILGLTIDYGPFQFLDAFDPGHICNHSDEQGRYAYNKQPNVAYWNLFCLGQALLPLIGEQELALAALESYKTVFPRELEALMRAKLGLETPHESDRGLIEDVLKLLARDRVDYTIFWRRLSQHVAGQPADTVRDLFLDRDGFDAWLSRFGQRQSDATTMLRTNPKYVLRNHLGELAIRQAKLGDHSMVSSLLRLVQSPFAEHPEHEDLAGFPPDWASHIEISCSS
jgi:uncharacterized protein YdiU (UPF0061 family)